MKHSVLNEILQTLYPDDIRCIVCGKEMRPNRYGLCADCSFDINENYCLRCGRYKVGMGDYCDECSGLALRFDEARSSVVYDDIAKSVVHRLKYGNARYLVKPISQYMLDTVMFADWQFDCFTYVPMFSSREKKRGYNQAKLLAKALSERTDVPCIDILEKIRNTPNQASMNREARLTNLKGAFEATAKSPDHVVLVDDIMTTGATASECAKTLKHAGAKVVYLLTFASVAERPVLDTSVQNISEFRK